MKFDKKLIYIATIIAILATTSVATAATEETWNDITFTVPEGFNTGTPGADKIAMVNGGDRILLETFDQDKLNELEKESELKGNRTFVMNDLNITELQFKTESGTKLLFLFSKNDKDYQISYFVPNPPEEEDSAESQDSTEQTTEAENNTTESNSTDNNSTEQNLEKEIDFDINDTKNPVNVLINSLKF